MAKEKAIKGRVGNITQVLSCTCPHRAQDDLYGRGRRLFIYHGWKKKGDEKMECTVCGSNTSYRS